MGLGVALGAYTNEYNNQRRMRRDDETHDLNKEQFGWKRDDRDQAQQLRASKVAELESMRKTMAALENPNDEANWAYLQEAAPRYGFANIARNGNSVGMFAPDEASGQTRFQPLDMNQLRGQAQDYYMQQLASLDPDTATQYLATQRGERRQDQRYAVADNQWQNTFDRQGSQFDATHGLARDTFDANVQHQSAVRGLQGRQVALAEQTALRPRFVTDSNGQTLAVAPDGSRVVNTFGTPKPQSMAQQTDALLADPQVQATFVQFRDYTKAAKENANNPEASNQYSIAARNAFDNLPDAIKLRAVGDLGPQLPPNVWDTLVEVEGQGPNNTTVKYKVPMSQALPDAFEEYQLLQDASQPGLIPDPRVAGGDTVAPPQETRVERAQRVEAEREARRAAARERADRARELSGGTGRGGLPTIIPNVTGGLSFDQIVPRTDGPLSGYGLR